MTNPTPKSKWKIIHVHSNGYIESDDRSWSWLKPGDLYDQLSPLPHDNLTSIIIVRVPDEE